MSGAVTMTSGVFKPDARATKRALPCPLCGGAGRLDPMPGAAGWWRVRCLAWECGCTTWAMDEAEKAVAAWNRR